MRRSASGVFRYQEDSENQYSDQLYLLENGCNSHGPNGSAGGAGGGGPPPHMLSDYGVDDMYQNPKDPFDG